MGFDILSFAIGKALGAAGGDSGGDSGGGSSGGENGLFYKTGTFTAADLTMTVEHGGNKVPDFLLIYLNGQPANMNLFMTYGYSEAMLEALGGGDLNIAYFMNNSTSGTVSSNLGIETGGSGVFGNYGGLRKVTNTTFTVGTSTSYNNLGSLKIDATYAYVAIYGIL